MLGIPVLTKEFGKGFSVKNLERMRSFYQIYGKSSTLLSKSENHKNVVTETTFQDVKQNEFVLSWSHYLKLMKIDDTPSLSELNDEEIKGLDWIRVEGEVSTRQYANHFDYGYKKAQRHLVKMRDLNLIEDNGEPTNSPNDKYVAKV